MAFRKTMAGAALMLCICAGTAPAWAHHSFAVFFDASKMITVTGKVKEFRFTNPHGLIVLDVPAAGGQTTEYRVETNAPVILQRRGWSRTILTPGEEVTIQGWPSRDGKAYMRLLNAKDAKGQPIGLPMTQKQD